MAPSDVRRFVNYLNDLSQSSHIKAAEFSDELSAAQVDFVETQQLLQQFDGDERLRNVLMDPTGQSLDTTLQSVQEALHEVEARSISAYIEEAQPLNDLHSQVRPCLVLEQPADILTAAQVHRTV
jgi:hypothetical protein